MFTENMIAPCGLDCSLCNEALKHENSCTGCMGPDENKPEFCLERCAIITCDTLKKNQYRFCTECAEYPCDFNKERETRYASLYVMKESPLTNLKEIQRIGMEAFLKKQREKWTCETCNGIICVHTGICSKCAKKYSAQDIAI